MNLHLPAFVYGTLRTGEGNHAWALAGKTDREVRATLNGARMHNYGGFPFVTREGAQPTDTVVGDLMYIPADIFPQVLSNLDRLEGYMGPGYPGNMYDRVQVTVTTDLGEQVTAWTYLASAGSYARTVHRLPLIESGDWLHRHTADPAAAGHGW